LKAAYVVYIDTKVAKSISSPNDAK